MRVTGVATRMSDGLRVAVVGYGQVAQLHTRILADEGHRPRLGHRAPAGARHGIRRGVRVRPPQQRTHRRPGPAMTVNACVN